MSTKAKKAVSTGVRYSDAEKQEIVDYVTQYNSSNGRGGQSAASKKFKVTPLTISSWLKAKGKKSKVSAKPVKPAKAAKAPKASGKSKKGVRYTDEQKQEVVDFVNDYNVANGRGGQSHAAKKFNLSVLTVSTWLKKAGAKGGAKVKAVKGKAVKVSAAVPAGLNAKFASLIEVSDQLRKAESETEKLRAKYDALRAAIQALI